jgi:hypothetical protein
MFAGYVSPGRNPRMVSNDPATCPLCGEEKAGVKSVEQHISGSTDIAHKGAHGPDYRDEIEGGESPDSDPDPDPVEEPAGEPEAVRVESPGDESPPPSGGAPSPDTATSETDEDGGGGVLKTVVTLGALAGLAALAGQRDSSGPYR